jgi:cysteinyl-tRNA synthetase
MKAYNTLTRRVEEVVPLEAGHIRLYTCGPTVYNFAHIGNYRAYMFEDLLRRHLKASGYRVTQVMNITDIDDKTIRGALEQGVSLDTFTRTYIEAFFEDLKTLGIEPAEHYPRATEHIPEMVALVGRLVGSGMAYTSEDGSVYFNVKSFEEYGKLAHLDVSGLRAGARVLHDEYDKESLADFALWKAWDESDGEVAWDSPWGRGRPGWHIECSAMSMKYLGETFDIHTGGVDNMFPHHENEIAQSEGATGKPFVAVWMHCEHLQVDGHKMSKSLGNFYTLRDIIEKGYTGRDVRYVLLSGHYRQTLNFTFKALDAARAALARIDEFATRLRDTAGASGAGDAPAWAADAKQRFDEALDDDLNAPEALAALFDMIHAGNRVMDSGGVDAPGAAGALAVLEGMDLELGVLGAGEEEVGPEVMALVEKRAQARREKRWAEADAIRDQLAGMGWEVRDGAEGAKVKKL